MVRPRAAVRHLRRIVEACERGWSAPVPVPIASVYLVGALLDGAEDPEASEVVLAVEREPAELTWGTTPLDVLAHLEAEGVARLPVVYWYRPAARPVDNHRLERPARIWNRADGTDETLLEALAADDPELLEPHRAPRADADELRARLDLERTEALAALTRVVDRFWERDWRREQRGAGRHAEHRLWDVAWGVADLEEVLKA